MFNDNTMLNIQQYSATVSKHERNSLPYFINRRDKADLFDRKRNPQGNQKLEITLVHKTSRNMLQ